jgi:hypothetical protein
MIDAKRFTDIPCGADHRRPDRIGGLTCCSPSEKMGMAIKRFWSGAFTTGFCYS